MRQLFLSVVMMLAVASGYAQPTSGTVGNDLTWTYSDGTLTIGAGWGDRVMPDFDASADMAPWLYYREDITDVFVESGVKNIGACAFPACPKLVSVSLPESVTSIGVQAFSHCTGLRSFYLPNEVTSIGNEAFSNCVNMEDIHLSLAIASIGDQAFSYCYNLRDISLPESLITIGEKVFEGCLNLRFINIPASVTSIGEFAFSGCPLTNVSVDWTTTPLAINRNVFENLILSDIRLSVPAGTKAIYAAAEVWKEFIIVDPACHSGVFGAGDALVWELCDGTLTISGSGVMPDYHPDLPPWDSYKNTIKAVVVELGVENIGSFAFYEYDKLESITLPESVTFIADYAFSWCLRLTEITVASNNLYYSSEDGVLFDKSKTTLMRYPTQKPGNSYTIPESVIFIEAEAFLGCRLESVTLPESVTSIGKSAFGGCYSLKSITLPESVTAIGDYAFSSCNSLESIIIPEKVNSIGVSAFNGCAGLKSIIIPASVTSIGDLAFGDCYRLTEIVVDSNNPAFSSESGVLFDKNKETIIQYPKGKVGDSYTVPGTVISIGAWAFFRCSSLESIIIPESVISIGMVAFQECSSLASIHIPASVTSIGGGAFQSCSSLESIAIPKAVTSIGDIAFRNCSGLIDITVNWTTTPPAINSNVFLDLTLSNITLHVPAKTRAIYEATEVWKEFTIVEQPYSCPSGTFGAGDALTWELCDGTLTISGSGVMPDYYGNNQDNTLPWYSYLEDITAAVIEMGVERVGFQSFIDCTNLESITLPASVTSIGDRAFVYCSRLTGITVDANNPSFVSEDGVLFDKNKATIIRYPEGKAGNSYTVPASVTSIVRWAFENCWRLTSIILPEGVNSIAQSAFLNCDGLTAITIPASVTSIGGQAFGSCNSLTEITVDANNPSYSSEDGILFDKDKATLLQYPIGRTGDSYTIPASVTSIGERAFREAGLASIHIPASVTSIGDNAFLLCNGLADVTVNWTTTPPSIDSKVFDPLTLSDITLHVPAGTKAIYEAAEVWKEFTIVEQPCPSGTFGVGDALAWELCEGTMTISGTGAMPDFNNQDNTPPWYSYRENITAVVVESGVESIGESAFYLYSHLASITLPESLTSIGTTAFYRCSTLASITLPESVNSIGERAFMGCSGLTDLTVNWTTTPPAINSDVFSGLTLSTINLHVPDGTRALYRTADVWKEFTIVDPSGATCPYGTFGPNNTLMWELCDGTLTISGAGAIPDYGGAGNPPWHTYRGEITSLILAPGVERIGAQAFVDYSHMASIALPTSVTSIGAYAFLSCSGLTTIELPASVASIGEGAFALCQHLNKIAVATNNATYSSEAGVLFDKSRATLLQYPAGKADNSYTLPTSVTTLGAYAFGACNSLTAITLPASVTTLGAYAFTACSSLTDLTVGWTATPPALNSNVFAGLTLSAITLHVPPKTSALYAAAEVWQTFTIADPFTCDWGTFGDSHALTWELCDETLTIRGAGAMPAFDLPGSPAPWYAYRDRVAAAVVEQGVTTIGDQAFAGCYRLASVVVPASVTSIGAGVFEDCGGLTEIAVAATNPYYSSGDGVLFNKNKSSLLRYPAGKAGAGYTIPASVLSIGAQAFAGSGRLASVAIPASVTAIGTQAFAGCSGLTEMTANWTEAGTLPAIGSDVFAGLTLSSITLNVPARTRSLYEGAEVWREFNVVDPSGCYWGMFGADNALIWELCDGTLTIRGAGAMPDYGTVQAVMGLWASSGDGNRPPWYAYRDEIVTVFVESGVTAIGARSFADCSSLTAVTLPESVLSLGAETFAGCTSLTDVTVSWTTEVPEIDGSVFAGLDLSEITLHIPEGVEDLYTEAEVWKEFNPEDPSGCHSGTFGEGNALGWALCEGVLTISGTGAMTDYDPTTAPWHAYREEITAVVIEPGVESIGAAAFYQCRLEFITLPETVTSIGNGAFRGCKTLVSITIPASVASIGEWVFGGCSRLTEIAVASNNPSYCSEDGVLFDAGKETIIRYPPGKAGDGYTIPESVLMIGNETFEDCRPLESIVIPASVISIGIGAFTYCVNLTELTVYWTETLPSTDPNAFFDVLSSGITLYVPNGTTALYESANVWKYFNIVEQPRVGIETIPPAAGLRAYVQDGWLHVGDLTAGEELKVYDVSGRLIHRQKAIGGEATVALTIRGMYILRTWIRSVKVTY
jgi:hypothetical protein